MTDIEMLWSWFRHLPSYHKSEISTQFSKAVKALEKAEKSRWIPTKEKMPTKGKHIIVAYEVTAETINGEPFSYYNYEAGISSGKGYFLREGREERIYPAVAWMEFKPYESEES